MLSFNILHSFKHPGKSLRRGIQESTYTENQQTYTPLLVFITCTILGFMLMYTTHSSHKLYVDTINSV